MNKSKTFSIFSFNIRALFPEQPRSFKDWEVYFQASAAVHFCTSKSSVLANVRKCPVIILKNVVIGVGYKFLNCLINHG